MKFLTHRDRYAHDWAIHRDTVAGVCKNMSSSLRRKLGDLTLARGTG
jgi:hypothetical protein